jgi:hypothetical protein
MESAKITIDLLRGVSEVGKKIYISLASSSVKSVGSAMVEAATDFFTTVE